jgi:putative endonuclease
VQPKQSFKTMDKYYYIYVLTNAGNNVLYTGVTNKRVYEHKNHLVKGFSDRYNATKLVYYQAAENIEAAIFRETN